MSGTPHSSLAGGLPTATLQDIIIEAFLTFVAETRLQLRPAASPAAFAAAFLSDQRVTPFPTKAWPNDARAPGATTCLRSSRFFSLTSISWPSES